MGDIPKTPEDVFRNVFLFGVEQYVLFYSKDLKEPPNKSFGFFSIPGIYVSPKNYTTKLVKVEPVGV